MKKVVFIAFALPLVAWFCFAMAYITLVYVAAEQLPPPIRGKVFEWMNDIPQETYTGHSGSASSPYNGGAVPADGYNGELSFACIAMGGERVTDEYGVPRGEYLHSGIDYTCNGDENLPVLTPFGGKVVFAEWSEVGYGNLVVIENHGVQVYLAHHSDLWVEPGQIVEAGQPVGTCGSTGNSTGPHVHFEVRVWSDKSNRYLPVDPNSVLLPGQEDYCDWYDVVRP